MGTNERTGVTTHVEILLYVAFDNGYEAGAEVATCGELLAEAQALQHAFYDLDGKTRRAIALDDLVMPVNLGVDCRGDTLRRVDGVRRQ